MGITPGFSADFDGAPGDVTTTRVDAGFTITIPAGERGSLDLGYDFELSSYDFDGATGLIPGTDDPWNELLDHRFSFLYSRYVSRQWAWLLGGAFGWAGEQDADPNESMYGLGYFGLRYAVSESLILGFGGGVRSKMEDDPYVIPFALIHWNINDRLSLSNEGRLGLTLLYKFNDRWSMTLEGEWDYSDYRLDEDGPVPNAIVRDERYPIGIGVRWTPTELVRFRAGLGVDFWRHLEVADEDGTELTDTDVDAAPFVGLQMTVRF